MTFSTHIGRYALSRKFGGLARRVLARPYASRDAMRVAVLYEPNRISFSQIYPFIFYAEHLTQRYGVELRFFSVETIDQLDFNTFDRMILQLWFDKPATDLAHILDRAQSSRGQLVAFLDSFAHNDLRLAPALDGHIRYYLKKSLFWDRDQFHQVAQLPDTNLSHHYAQLYNLSEQPPRVPWQVPEGFLSKLRLSPNFFTDPNLMRLFSPQSIDSLQARERPIDLHARLNHKGTEWYSKMRNHALHAVSGLSGMRCVSQGMVDTKTYRAELMSARMCFSPFGYGELCWRDIEAIAFGAVLLKPDMSHLQTLPNLYEAGRTYVPVRWDFSDLPEKVDWVLTHPEETDAIIREAHRRICDYLARRQFVEDMQFLFQE